MREAIDAALLSGKDAVGAFDQAWESCAARAAKATIFQSAAWYRSWLEGAAVPEGAEPLVLRVPAAGKMRIGLPLQISSRSRQPASVAPLSTPWADYQDAVLVDADASDIIVMARALGLMLRDMQMSFCGEDIQPEGPLSRILDQLPHSRRPSTTTIAIDLTDTAHVERLLSSREHKVKRRRLERCGRLTCVHHCAVEPIRQRLVDFIAMHRAQWAESADAVAPFEDPAVERTFFAMVEHLAPAGQLVLSELLLDQLPIAMYFGFVRGQRFYAYRTCYRTDYFQYSPGHILVRCMISEFCRNGIALFDLMRGGYAYKFSYASDVRQNLMYTVKVDDLLP